ncbi:hypothetical protein HHI36_021632 [Cryptolaemus montrouzieri]|uniref:DUF2428 domain-containing protein n=1 Tax=Cryptolaemus montrouzieri TaxID=559131 RepID=A0ABD2MXQ6_9CUCU
MSNDLDEIVLVKYQQHFTDKIIHTLLHLKICDDNIKDIFEMLQNLSVLITAHEIGVCKSCSCGSLGLSMLNFMVDAVEQNLQEGLSTKTRKVVEYLFCGIIQLLGQTITDWKKYSRQVLNQLIILIDKSNIRKLVTDALNMVTVISEKLENSRCCRMRKIKHQFFEELLDSIVNLNNLRNSKMRKHPSMRALLHAICKGSGKRQKFYVQTAISQLLAKTEETSLNCAVHTITLECLEILMAEPSFHPFTFDNAEKIIKFGLKSFGSKIWTIKNAAIQLTNTIITRFFGVQQTDSVRLRSFQEFCVLFPELTDYFYDVLSKPMLDEKSIIVLQYISASEVLYYEHLDKRIEIKIKDF